MPHRAQTPNADMHVDACVKTIADSGSIPDASTKDKTGDAGLRSASFTPSWEAADVERGVTLLKTMRGFGSQVDPCS